MSTATKRRRIDSPELCQDAVTIPQLTADADTGLISSSAFRSTYDEFQAVYLPQLLSQSKCNDSSATATLDLASLFDSLTDDDKKTFCIENAAENGDGDEEQGAKPSDFLKPATETFANSDDTRRGYCSFLVQDPEKLSSTLEQLPMPHLPLSSNKTNGEETTNSNSCSVKEESSSSSGCNFQMRHGPCLWIFFGRNGSSDTKESLAGRPEHTDSVAHDGTWHYQLSGIKEWHLRPTSELIRRRQDRNGKNTEHSLEVASGLRGNNEGRVVVKCSEGDVLIVNTRLWWHATKIPVQPNDADGKPVPSVSYARDVFFESSLGSQNVKDKVDNDKMSNLDGLYAADDISANTIIFTEKDMPDIELHRSATDPNCEVIQLDDGMGAIVSRRQIKAGEFFCIEESSDDDEDVGNEEGEFEEEEEEE